MEIINQYLEGLKKAYQENNLIDEWNHFEKIKHGAPQEDLEKLKKIFPEIPHTLLKLLEFVDGTYWRKYENEEIAFYLLGSDVEEYPYYLLSVEQIIKNKSMPNEYYDGYIERLYKQVKVDAKITKNAKTLSWLHFSDCMNNGGTSQLFIDFSPSKKGKVGQIIRYLHDPDEFSVIADSFDDYLKLLINNNFDFIFDEEEY